MKNNPQSIARDTEYIYIQYIYLSIYLIIFSQNINSNVFVVEI